MDQLSPQDAQFLYMESDNNLAHVTSISIFDPTTVPRGRTVRFKDIIAHVEDRLRASPLLKRKLVRVPLELDYPYWVDDEYFDLEYHLRHGRLPEPGDWRQFCIHMARYHSRPLDMNRPLWEMFVVEGLDHIAGLPRGSYAIATKIHHAAVDGGSMVRFFGALTDKDNRGTPFLSLQAMEDLSSPRPSLMQMARRGAQNTLRSPLRVTEAFMRAAPGVYRALQTTLEARGRKEKKYPVPQTRFNVDVSPRKMFDATVFALDDLKAIRPAVPGCTINDVVLAICSGALRRYLQHHRELPEAPLVAWVPINARPGGAGDIEAPGNNISAMTSPIYTDIPQPLERLRAIMESTRQSKEAKSGLSARLMTDLTRHIPAATQVLVSRLVLLSGVAARSCNLFVSNVPGPQVPQYMNGARIWGSFGLAPLADGMGLFIATPSFDGKISFNVISTREILPDIDFFIECLVNSKEELLQAALRETGRAPARGSKRQPKKRKTVPQKQKVSARGGRSAPANKRLAGRKAAPDTKASSLKRTSPKGKPPR